MTIQIRKAERRKAKLRMGISGPSGSGKTYSGLKLAFGLGGTVGLIDTEHGSGDLYAHLGDYDIINIEAPYTVQKYLQAIKAFEDAGYNVIVIDSLSHAWAGDGGLLDKQGKAADRLKNSYTAWREVTPDHNALVDAILQSPAHIIGTMRSKTEYVLEEGHNGKKVPKKVGMAPVQRDGMEYEFTVFMDISHDHTAYASKDRTGLFGKDHERISEDTGVRLLQWLDSGTEPLPREPRTDAGELKPMRHRPTDGAMESLTTPKQLQIRNTAADIEQAFEEGLPTKGLEIYETCGYEQEEKIALWSLLGSTTRSTIKKMGKAKAEPTKEAA
jgi:hypothetical protein